MVTSIAVVTEEQLVLEETNKKNQNPAKVFFFSKEFGTPAAMDVTRELTSFSEVPHMLQHLHSMHCQRYVLTAAIMMGVNCRQDGWPEPHTHVC